MNSDNRVKVLLLEDDTDDYRLIARQLKGERCEFVVDWVDTVASAVEKLQEFSFDVILSDLHLPDSAGLNTVSKLRQQCDRTPIIVLTSLDDDSVERDLLAVKAQDYLVKGEFGGRAVARAILHAVQRQESMDEITNLIMEQVQSEQRLKEQAWLLREKNERLQKLNRTAQEFVDNVSHDFRTPLTVIKDYAAIIREGMIGEINEEQKKMLDKVTVRVDDLNNMVDDLLDVSKLDSGLLSAWRRNCRIEDIVERTKSMLQQRALVKNVTLQCELDDNLPEVYCDFDKVGRVITNIAVNALKFAGDGGHVKLWVEADPAGNQVVVGVTDNGPGIDERSLEEIFQRFEQLDEVQTTSKGFGLGLNIAQRLCQLNLGELGVQSQVGKGSTFSFTIPIANPREVLRRWLSTDPASLEILQIIEVKLKSETNANDADELDRFLNCLLRSDDLMFRTESGVWLIVMAVPRDESKVWFERAEKEFQKTNRNRPLGPLPSFSAEINYEWHSLEDHDEVLRDFEGLLHETAVPGKSINTKYTG